MAGDAFFIEKGLYFRVIINSFVTNKTGGNNKRHNEYTGNKEEFFVDFYFHDGKARSI
jgi:hypothetical protein